MMIMLQKRRFVLCAASIVALLLSAIGQAAERPNFVVVFVDDLRWDELGCMGHPYVKTPHIDRVAREGMRFENAFCTTPLCSPSRGSIFTMQYAHKHGIVDNVERGEASHRLDTFPRHLQAAGYETAFVGKWHMGNDATPRPGFDDWLCLEGQGSCYDSKANDNGRPTVATGYVTDVLNRRAADFIARQRAKPFMLFLSHKAIHPELTQFGDGTPSDPLARTFIPAPRHADLYADAKIPRRENFNQPPRNKPALEQTIEGVPPLSPATSSGDDVILGRQRMLAAIDDGVGMLLDALANSNQMDNTVFIFTSDHGYFYGEHCLSVERRLAYEETIRVPLLVRYPPEVQAGSKCEAFALLIDVGPTLLDYAGVKLPSGVHGRSLRPLLTGTTPADWRQSFLIEYFSDTVFPRVHKMGYQAVRTPRHTYIHYLEISDADELYDLQADPYQLHNRVADPAAQPVLAELKAELQRLLKASQ